MYKESFADDVTKKYCQIKKKTTKNNELVIEISKYKNKNNIKNVVACLKLKKNVLGNFFLLFFLFVYGLSFFFLSILLCIVIWSCFEVNLVKKTKY